MKRTYYAKPSEIEHRYYLVDAQDKILGRLATRVAILLRGKHKPNFTPNVDCGDGVIVINAAGIRVTGNKLKEKVYRRYSGFPAGQRSVTLENMLKKRPTQVLRLAISRMLPKNPLGRKMLKKLKIYSGVEHPHQAQKPVALEV
ncbi:MAG: 50S ribosomal protein L13 [Candidatus Omnitrophota bacterium]